MLDHQNPDHIYLSRNLAGKFEIEHRRRLPGEEWHIQLITENSPIDNVRPFVVCQSAPETAHPNVDVRNVSALYPI